MMSVTSRDIADLQPLILVNEHKASLKADQDRLSVSHNLCQDAPAETDAADRKTPRISPNVYFSTYARLVLRQGREE